MFFNMLSEIKHKIEPFNLTIGNLLIEQVSCIIGLLASQESFYFYLAKTSR